MINLKSFLVVGLLLAVMGETIHAQGLPPGCDCFSTLEWMPVCGSDGVTYGNMNTFKCAVQCGAKDLKVAHEGPC